MNLNEEFQVHETLNPKLWDVTTKQLLPEVRKKLIEIVTVFEQELSVPIEIVDVQLCGSNASYNYTEQSDIDCHIIANFEAVDASLEVLQAAYNLEKSNFNKTYDISVHGVDVEMYIQDIKSTVVSNGIYSVCENKWIKEPKPITSITKHNTTKEVEKWVAQINSVMNTENRDEVTDVINAIYLMRHNSIAADGEYGKGNAIFKDLRNLGMIEKLKDKYHSLLERELTLESLF